MTQAAGADLVELVEPPAGGSLVNADLAPTPISARTWGRWHFVSLWVGLSVCIPTYMLAASMTQAGMTWWQSLLAILLGNVIVLFPMIINAHAGTRYGIPFPVYARANVVAPANSFTNLSPQRVSFRTGGLLAGLLGIAIMPWKLLDVYQGWLISYSGLLGAVGGVIVCDYLVLRRGRLVLVDLYRHDGIYGYTGGINWRAVAATMAGVAVAVIGLVIPGLEFLFSGAWFSATLVSFVTYYVLMRRAEGR